MAGGVLDFTSSLYLGLQHPSGRLASWRSLTTGVPAALSPAAGTHRLEARIASLYGCEQASLAPSTLHLVWDVFGHVAAAGAALYVDAGAYATLRWGAERAAGRGVPVRVFPHHDEAALARLVAAGPAGRAPVVVCDGLCPRCGRCAPLAGFLGTVAPLGGWVVIDDTQAVGLLGERPAATQPYGSGGGGTPRHLGVSDPALLSVASFAKGLGAPVAALLGSREAVAAYERESGCRVHSSPPSAASLRALARALRVNARAGDELRARLADRIERFRAGVLGCGLTADAGQFPVQSVSSPGLDAVGTHRALLEAGVRAVLRAGRHGPELCFVVTARHSPRDAERAVEALALSLRCHGSRSTITRS
jgi:8-amino-7-oxononanoate synthase